MSQHSWMFRVDGQPDLAVRCAAQHTANGIGHLVTFLRILSGWELDRSYIWWNHLNCAETEFGAANAIVDLLLARKASDLSAYLRTVHLATLREAELSKKVGALVDALAYLCIDDWTERHPLESAHWALWRGGWCETQPR